MKENKPLAKAKYQNFEDENQIDDLYETKNEDINSSSIIDEVINKSGYNITTNKIIFLVFNILMVEGLHMTLFSSLLIPITKFFSISDNEIKFVSSILFIGVGIGSFVSGSITEKYGRPLIINLFLFLIFISHIILGLTVNFKLFALFRFIIGFSLGLIVPMSINLLTEFLPLYLRSMILTGIWTGFSCGSIFLQCLMLLLMPNFETAQFSNTILASSLLVLASFIFNIFLLYDSPRNLILRNKDEDAVLILNKISSRTFDNKTRLVLLSQVREGANKELKNNLSEIFNKKYMCLSILLTYVWFFNSVVSYGPMLISSLTMKMIGPSQSGIISSNTQVIADQIIINLISMPSSLLGGILSEWSFLGRNKSTILNFFMSLIFLVVLLIDPNSFAIYFGLFQGFVGISFSINTTYTCEVYPTKIRDQAVGFLFFCTRVGGFLSQIAYLYMQQLGIWCPYYFTFGFILFNILLIYLLPYETYGQPLDFDYSDKTQTVESVEIKKDHGI